MNEFYGTDELAKKISLKLKGSSGQAPEDLDFIGLENLRKFLENFVINDSFSLGFIKRITVAALPQF